MARRWTSRRYGRVLSAVMVSLAAHLAALIPMLLREPLHPLPEQEVVELTIGRRWSRTLSAPKPRAAIQPSPAPEQPLAQPELIEPAAAASANSPVAAATGPGSAPVEPAGPALRPLGGLILGCAGDVRRMSADQRRRCEDRQFGDLAKRDPHNNGKVQPPDIDPRKVQHYERVIAAKKSDGHAPFFGCFVPFGAPKTYTARKPKKKGPPHSLKAGPLPCYLVPPQGFMTPEADVAPLETPYIQPPTPKPPPYRPAVAETE